MTDPASRPSQKPVIWFPRLARFFTWVGVGVGSGALIYQILVQLVDVTLKLTYLGSGAIFGVWVVLEGAIGLLRPRLSDQARIKQVGWQTRFTLLGVLVFLWLRVPLAGLYTPKVEIILDASERMLVPLGDSGVTKFQAARAGALEAVDYFESMNTAVGLRVLYGDSSGQCRAVVNERTWTGFSQDYDELRRRLQQLSPHQSNKAPLVDALTLAMQDYSSAKYVPQNYHIYGFVGGDDTCDRSVELFLKSVNDNAVITDLFLVILLGKEEPPSWGELPNTSYAFARTASEVQSIVETYNREIAPPAGAPTRSNSGMLPSITPRTVIETLTHTFLSAPEAVPDTSVPAVETDADQPNPVRTPTDTARPVLIPSSTRTFTAAPSQTRTWTPVPSATATALLLPTDTETLAPTPTFTLSPCPSPRGRLAGAASYPGTATIAALGNCASDLPAQTAIPTEGTYVGTPENTFIWLLVYPWSQGTYYPQSPNACASPALRPVQGDGNWSVDTYLGQKEMPPEWFDLVLVVTDQAASDFISDWVHGGCPENYSGIPRAELEGRNITELFSISVQTKFTPLTPTP